MINTKFPTSGIANYYTKQEVQQMFLDLIDNAPDSLDTLNVLATALADDSNFAAWVKAQLDLHASIVYVDRQLALKANITDMDTALALKANQLTTYSKTEVDGQLALKG